MRVAEYQKYTRMRADWISAGTDQHDAPDPAMMLMATQEEVVELEEEQCRPRSYFRESFKEIELLLLSYNHTLSEEERDEIILTLCAKLLPLREAVLRAEEIWEEDLKHAEDRHREDIEKLACINQNESLIAIAKELECELNATVGTLQLVWPFLYEDDGHGANAPAYQKAIDAVKAVLAVKKGGQL
jgi:hypothetical protein